MREQTVGPFQVIDHTHRIAFGHNHSVFGRTNRRAGRIIDFTEVEIIVQLDVLGLIDIAFVSADRLVVILHGLVFATHLLEQFHARRVHVYRLFENFGGFLMQVVLGKRPREIHIIPRNQLRAVFHLSHQRFGKLQALRIVALVVIDVHVKTAQNRVVRLSLRHLRYQFQGFVLIAAEVQQRRITRQILHIRSLDVHVFRKSVRRFGKLFVLVIYVGQLPVGDRIFRIHLDQLVQHIDRILRIGTAVNLGVFEISLLAFVIEIDSLLVAARRIAVLLFSGSMYSIALAVETGR